MWFSTSDKINFEATLFPDMVKEKFKKEMNYELKQPFISRKIFMLEYKFHREVCDLRTLRDN